MTGTGKSPRSWIAQAVVRWIPSICAASPRLIIKDSLLMLGFSSSRTSATVFFAADLFFVACFTDSPPSTPTLGATSDGYAENPRGFGKAYRGAVCDLD